MARQPALGGPVLMDVQVVEHHVKGAAGEGRDDVVHEAQKVD